MPKATNNSMRIHFETIGDRQYPALILIAGLGEQSISWPTAFCEALSNIGLFVIRFDNRDTGLSTKLDSLGIPDLNTDWKAYYSAKPIFTPYTLTDMAADAVGVLDATGIQKAYVCGFSLGGMVAQHMAFDFPERTSGLVCLGSSSGDLNPPPPTAKAQAAMASPPPTERKAHVEHMVSVFKVFANGSKHFDPKCRESISASSFDRCFYPIGFMRQSAAMLADGSRLERLKRIDVPTLVMNGELDPVAQLKHGKAIAGVINDAKFISVPEWGHGLDYPKLWPLMAEHIKKFIIECSGKLSD
jgi:pimeloyl-ACP methyl ester carboxylesterase